MKIKKSMLNAIKKIDSIEEMNDVIELIKLRQKQLRRSKADSVKSVIRAGSRVEVSADNTILNGVVVKVNRTKAVVTIPNYNGRPTADYTVPLTMIRAA
tara:strand:+ start:252 stop:548 length:297 start_codon:yes stop_codon:yes gene_type:complete